MIRPVEPDVAAVARDIPCSSARRARRAASRPVMSRKWSSSTWFVSRRSSWASSSRRGRGSRDVLTPRGTGRAGGPASRWPRRPWRRRSGARRRAARARRRSRPPGAWRGSPRRPRRRQAEIFTRPDGDVQRVAGIALVEDHLAAPEAPRSARRARSTAGRSGGGRGTAGRRERARRAAGSAATRGLVTAPDPKSRAMRARPRARGRSQLRRRLSARRLS